MLLQVKALAPCFARTVLWADKYWSMSLALMAALSWVLSGAGEEDAGVETIRLLEGDEDGAGEDAGLDD